MLSARDNCCLPLSAWSMLTAANYAGLGADTTLQLVTNY
jgi:hypothetical protein